MNTKRRLIQMIGVSLALLLAVPATVRLTTLLGHAEADSTVVVQPADMQGWGFFQEVGGGTGSFVSGLGTAPLGSGSARMTVDATGREILATQAYAGTRLDAIDTLTYSTYRTSGDAALAISLQLDVDYDLTDTDTSWQGRLIFEPYYTNTVQTGVWQTWDALTNDGTGNWWASGAPGNTVCPIDNPCTWSEVLSNFPNAGIRADVGLLHLKAGGPWASGFDGNVDAFSIGISGSTTTYDFEPSPPPTVVYVDDDWAGTPLGMDPDGTGPANMFGYDAFDKIQDGIDNVASSTVNVAAGTYAETINVDGRSDINIVGADRDTVIVKPASTLPWNVGGYGASRQAAVRVVSSTDITLSGMTFDFDLVKNDGVTGMLYWDSTGTIDNNVLKNMGIPDTPTDGGYSEIMTYIRAPGYSDGARAAVTVSNNTFLETGRVAVLTHDFVNATIEDNTFTKTVDDFGYAMEIGSRSTATVTGNTISGYDTPAASDGSAAAAIYVENSFTGPGFYPPSGLPHISKPVTISDNNISGNQYGVYIGNEWDTYAGDIDIVVTMTGNNIHDNTDGGVYVVDEDREYGSSVTLNASGNTVSNNGNEGYHFFTYKDGEIHAVVSDDTISGQQTGVLVDECIYPDTAGMCPAGPSSSLYDLTVHASTIGGSSYGINNTTTALLNAEDNWWGSANGPTHPSNTFNVGSQGVPVSDNVDFVPWLNAAPPSGVSFAPVTTTSPSGSYASIQAGVTASNPGGTVNAKAGTFTEQPDIGKQLTLTGAGQVSTIIKSPAALATKFANNKPVVYIHDATGVTVQQLTVDGDGEGNANYRMQGIAFYNAGGTVDHVTVTRVRETPLSGTQHGVALYAYNADGTPRSLNISNDTINEYQKNGMALIGTGLTVAVTGNTVTGSGATGVIAQNGIQVSGGATGTVDGNTVSNNSYTGAGWSATDILVSSANVDITGNHLNNGMLGLYYIDGSGTISGNTVSATTSGVGRPDYWGIAVMDPPDLTASPFEEEAAPPAGGPQAAPMGAGVMTVLVCGNTLTGDGSVDSVGLEADAGWYGGTKDVNFTASGNTISNWGTGVEFTQCDSDCGGGVFTSVDVGPDNGISAPVADPSNSGLHAMGAINLDVHNNTFTGGYDAIKLRLAVTGTVKDNVVSGYAKNGITVGKAADDNTGTNVTVSGNSVTGGGAGQVNAQNGIQVGPNAVARIQNNSVSNHVYTLGTGACAGPGTKGDKAYYDACWTAAGIMVYQGTATVTGNAITANQVGVDDSGAEIHNNLIWDNVIYGVNNSSAGVADAENNWWGSCSGPYHPTANPSGTGDAVSDNVDFTPWTTGPCDSDGDLLTDDQETLVYHTDPHNPDTDGDGCVDGREVLYSNPTLGGLRDPLNFWDFFDVTGDRFIDLSDALDILSYFGNPGLPGTLGDLRDRSIPDPAKPWRTADSDDGVDLTDALNNLMSFGDDCSGPP
jgi:hypothetical protein